MMTAQEREVWRATYAAAFVQERDFMDHGLTVEEGHASHAARRATEAAAQLRNLFTGLHPKAYGNEKHPECVAARDAMNADGRR